MGVRDGGGRVQATNRMDLINKVTWSKYLKEVREFVMHTSGRRAFQAAGKTAKAVSGAFLKKHRGQPV